MAIKWPLANGVWSNAANWNDGTLPDVGDDVYADGKTITIDQNVTVLSIRNDQRSGGTANGGFNFATTLTTYNITADLFGFNAALITFNQGSRTYNLIGNLDHLAGTTASLSAFLANTNAVNINIVGNIIARGQANARNCISVTATGVNLNVIGNITGGTSSGGIIVNGVNISGATNIISITGNLTSQSVGTPSIAAQNPSALFVNSTSNTIIVYGNLLANATINLGAGITVVQTANTIYIFGDVVGNLSFGNFNGALIVGASSNNIYVDKIVGSTNGTGVAVQNLTNSNVIVKEFEISSIGTVPAIGKIIVDDNTFAFKAINESNQTVIYSDNVLDFIPTEPNVRKNTTYYDGLKVGTLEVPNPSNVRKGVPTDNTVGTADLTAEDFWTYATRSLTEAPDVPTAQEISDQVWLDEPERLKNVATVETTGDQLAAL
jgi:hypothetical protein